jgi:hypothetical protein
MEMVYWSTTLVQRVDKVLVQNLEKMRPEVTLSG